MKKIKLYLDASAVGYLDEQTSPQEMRDMLTLWEEIRQDKYDVVLSEVTLNEIYANRNVEKVKILAQHLIEISTSISYEEVIVTDEVRRIAALIKSNGILISDKHENDRLHIGCAVVSGCDVLVSYNFRHLVNVRTIKGVRGISNLAGYGNIDIMPASMLIEKGDESDAD